ncbi:TPA: sulfide/dihydroorotate dehydrogenase-like FAD/NAD-binding protein [bacterium]|nr:MAG: ferredoxin-NADP reductase [Candidatus Hydrogenedentes bacterium CG1_02_42_14]HBW47813.1 sulfide/dihydroorotate dehydrogenase-like FAD/NAD-binding protein [bacterium]
MFKIITAKFLSPETKLFEIEAPRIAKKQKAGQFVILRVHSRGERIPLTIAGSDSEKGTITLIVQGIGKTTKLLNLLEAGDSISDAVGPLGKPSEIALYGTVAVIGGGVGTAIAYPTARAMKEAGNTVISIVGARSKDFVILEEEVRKVSDEFYLMTDDGTKGEKGFVTVKLAEILKSGRKLDYVLAIGPVPMMKAVAETTRSYNVKTVVSLNSIMVDGTGMCGGCRAIVGGASKFACVDGPEFDAHIVDFDAMMKRNSMYRENEKVALERFALQEKDELERVRHECKLEGMSDGVDNK